MTLVNRPTQPFGFAYEDTGPDNLEYYAEPGGLVIAGRVSYGNADFQAVSAGGGCVLLYLDPIIDNPYGRYHNYLMGRDDSGTPNSGLYGTLVPRWPGEPSANEWGHLTDFRVGGVLQSKLASVLELAISENPHLGGFFIDDTGSRSWFPDITWAPVTGIGSEWSTGDKEDYRDGAIAICQTVRDVCDDHGLIFIVNGTWGAGSSVLNGGGYPDMEEHGISLADGGYVEHHPISNLTYFTGYANSTQWASDSPVTNGTSFMLYAGNTNAERDAYIASDAFAYCATQPGDDYGSPPIPWSELHATGLPTGSDSDPAYTELEWSLRVQAPAVDDDVYEFRVYADSDPLNAYPQTPQLTVAAAEDIVVAIPPAILHLGARPVTAAGAGAATPTIPAATLRLGAQPVTATGSGAATPTVPAASLRLGARPVTAAGSGAATPAIPSAALRVGARPVTAAGSGAATRLIPIASLLFVAQVPVVGGPITPVGMLTCDVDGPVVRRLVRGPGKVSVLVTGPAGETVSAAGPGTALDTTGPALTRTVVTGPAREAVTVFGPQVYRDVTGPLIADVVVVAPGPLTADVDGPAVRRLVTGPGLVTFVVRGPATQTVTVAGAATTVDTTGPMLTSKVVTGPAREVIAASGPDVYRDVTGPLIEEFAVTGAGVCDGD